jgi:maltose alpha-D-glucosyltransferase/alpha-amylase
MIEDLWYRNTVVYSLDLETFQDSDGDGVGDFQGLMSRLDYLDALGVGTVWLAPFQPSPNRDNGYDISDFYGVDPRHGSSGDFVEFIHHARTRGIKVIIDLVANHTSDQHPWFQEARRDADSPRRDWYVWSKERPSDWDEGMVFPGVQKSTWTRDPVAGAYYFHRFYPHQPDLNIHNPAVREEIRRIMGYWLELGVDGFRVDAVPFILESAAPGPAKPELNFEYLYDMRRFAQWRRAGAVLLGEANVLPAENRKFFGAEGGGLQMMFNFFANQHLFLALATEDARPLADAIKATRNLPHGAQWGHFLRNHDELDLGRLSDEDRARVFARYAPEEGMRLYGRGIRRRMAPMMGDRRQLELASSLMFSLPGTPVIRYGDEIGMGDDLRLPERDAVRTPMQWTDEPQGGFSTAAKTVHPVIEDGVYGYRRVNVAAQQRDASSLLRWHMRMIRMRKECPEIGWGTWTILRTGAPAVLAMRFDWEGRVVVTLHNLSDRACEVRIRPDADRLVSLTGGDDSDAGADGAHRIVLEPFGYHWYRAGTANYALPG